MHRPRIALLALLLAASCAPPAERAPARMDAGGADAALQDPLPDYALQDPVSDAAREPESVDAKGTQDVLEETAVPDVVSPEIRQPDAAAPAVPAPQPAPEGFEDLRADIEALRLLIEGKKAQGGDPAALLGADVMDGEAVASRIAELGIAIDTLETERDTLLAGPQGAADEDADAVEETPPEPTAEQKTRLEEIDLLVERARLLVTFLSLPIDKRTAALSVDPGKQKLAVEFQAAAVAREEADAAEQKAAAARLAALDAAAGAAADAVRLLAVEEARFEGAIAALAKQRSLYAEQRKELAQRSLERQKLIEKAKGKLSSQALTGEQADVLHEQILSGLTGVRAEIEVAFADLKASSLYDDHQPELDPSGDEFDAHAVELARLLASIDRLGKALATSRDEERELRWSRARNLVEQDGELYELSLAIIPRLSLVKRERVLGMGPDGLGQLRREARQVWLDLRWQAHSWPAQWRRLLAWSGDVMSRASSRWTAIQLAVLIIAIMIVLVRRRELWSRVHGAAASWADGRDNERSVVWLLDLSGALGLPAIMLAAAWLGLHLLGDLVQAGWLAVVRSLVLAYAWYRLLLAASHHFLLSAAGTRLTTVSLQLSGRILESMRLAGRFILVVIAIVLVTRGVVGRGYIHMIVVSFSWLGAIPIGYVLLRRWRDDAFDAFLGIFPEGRLASWAGSARGRLWGILLLLPAVAILLGRALWILLASSVMKFERTRRALAYLFRRRMEKQKELLLRASTDRSTLPGPLRRAFTTLVPKDDTRVESFAHMQEVLELIEHWKAEGRGCAVALVGERGIGKTTWLEELAGRAGPDVVLAKLDDTLIDESSLCSALARILGAGEASSVEEIVEAVEKMPPRVIMLNHCQNLVLRCVGGVRGLEAFARIVRRTMGRMVWVCSFSRYVWEHVEFVLQDQIFFTHVHMLPGWSEEHIRELIEKRMAHSGFQAVWDDLLEVQTDDPAEIERVRERYFRLLWDYSDGIPRIATHFWMRSLVLEEDRTARVRLFQAMEPDDLEALQELSRFMLLGVVHQENLTVEEAEKVLGYSRGSVVSLLEMLRARGYLKRYRERYRVTLTWDRAAVRYLRRKHLLYS